MSLLRPVGGSPEGVLAVADALAAGAARLDAVRSVLAGTGPDARWDGEAGRAFGERVGGFPPVLDAVVQRYAGAAAALRTLADVLAEVQRVTTAAVHTSDEAEQVYAVLEDRAYARIAAGAAEGDADVSALRRLQTEQMARSRDADLAHAAALGRFGEADRLCAARLRALAEDSLVDSHLYRALATAQDAGTAAAEVGTLGVAIPPLRPVGLVGGVVASGAQATILLGWGDGDWGAVATGAALAAVGAMGAVAGAAPWRARACRGTAPSAPP